MGGSYWFSHLRDLTKTHVLTYQSCGNQRLGPRLSTAAGTQQLTPLGFTGHGAGPGAGTPKLTPNPMPNLRLHCDAARSRTLVLAAASARPRSASRLLLLPAASLTCQKHHVPRTRHRTGTRQRGGSQTTRYRCRQWRNPGRVCEGPYSTWLFTQSRQPPLCRPSAARIYSPRSVPVGAAPARSRAAAVPARSAAAPAAAPTASQLLPSGDPGPPVLIRREIKQEEEETTEPRSQRSLGEGGAR